MDDRERLGRYREHVRRLQACEFQPHHSIEYTFEAKQGLDGEWLPFVTSTVGPSEPELLQFLVAFRHFSMNNSPVKFETICNILQRVLQIDADRRNVADIRRQYLDRLKRPDRLGVARGQEPVTAAILIEQWINAYHFHDDAEGEQPIQEWDMVAPGLYRYLLVEAVQDLAQIIIGLDCFVAKALEAVT